MVYELSNQIGRYAVRTRFCEVFVNTNGGALSYNDYVGVYSFMEKIKRDKNRVNINRLAPDDNSEPEITGGYIFKIDRPDPGDSGFSAGGQGIKWLEPKEDDITAKQSGYARGYLNTMYKNLSHTTKYRDFIDDFGRQYVCTHCAKVLRTQQAFAKHERECDDERYADATGYYECGGCGVPYSNARAARRCPNCT